KNTFTFEEAKNIYLESSKLDESFYNFSKIMLEEGRVDVYPKTGKSGGAFCANFCRISPVYVLLNFTGKLRDVTTLAHEFGHAINFELAKKNSELNYGVSTFVAEVASTFMEDVTGKYLEQSLNENDRLAYMMDKLNGTISTIFRQIACYEFEMDLHTKYKGKSFLSNSDIGELFSKAMKSYTGPAVKFSPGSENWWVYWSHIRSFFYVYSYAGGELIAKALSAKLTKDPTFIKQIKAFYEAGLDKSPKDIFSEMGLDITNENFWEEGIQQIIEDLNSAETLAKKLGKI
ncbi:MAG: oligoendopeptidase, partial [Patescibacteria group bacterium]|nr:oligoendopeptidase [Patescibacteria group bacterium]